MNLKFRYLPIIALFAFLLVSCGAQDDNAGTEYAPQMYHSVAYEPLSQVTDKQSDYFNSLPYNDYKGNKFLNMRTPVEGTVSRQNYVSVTKNTSNTENQEVIFYDLHKDSVDLAGRILKNPIKADSLNSAELLAQGKHLYLGFCSPCHGETGKGDGKVGEAYKGVPNYTTGRYKTLPEGHIFHTITHGKGRMWSHKSQINPEERWKIVLYVQQLQKGS
ncbi:MAG: cytochrome c [Bacteroidetes bacterium]|nr:MAG: cytochrome c [Bacteroidota bacterium]